MASYAKRQRTKMVAEINVVPYIDVMLVLLIIFMVASPSLTQGVKVELPEINAPPVDQKDLADPLVVTVDADGSFFANLGDEASDRMISRDSLAEYVLKIVRTREDTPVFVRGSAKVEYGQVLDILALIQEAGVSGVSLITTPPDPFET